MDLFALEIVEEGDVLALHAGSGQLLADVQGLEVLGESHDAIPSERDTEWSVHKGCPRLPPGDGPDGESGG